MFQELRATRVEGSVFEFVQHEVGQPFVVRDMNGRVVLGRGLASILDR